MRTNARIHLTGSSLFVTPVLSYVVDGGIGLQVTSCCKTASGMDHT